MDNARFVAFQQVDDTKGLLLLETNSTKFLIGTKQREEALY